MKIVDPSSTDELPVLFKPAEWLAFAVYLSLSPRQVEIAQLICRGRTTKELAGSLGIATDTVRKHRVALYHKLDSFVRTPVFGVAHRLLAGELAA